VLADADRAALRGVLERAKGEGHVGGGPDVDEHIGHAQAMAACVGVPSSFLDLGSGAGIPGLILAMLWPERSGTLVEARARRVGALRRAVAALGLEDRVSVVHARAEEVAREALLREGFAVVCARAFAPPAVTAEIATGFLRVGGRLVVAEPPGGDPGRWPPEGLAKLGFGPAEISSVEGRTFAVVRKATPAGARWPRRSGMPGKRPLW